MMHSAKKQGGSQRIWGNGKKNTEVSLNAQESGTNWASK